MIRPAPCLVACALSLAAAAPARANPIEDFADALKDYTGEHTRAWVLTKLTTWKLGAKCAGKLADKKQGALHAASFATRDIVAYAKAVTGDDWSGIEGQSNSDRAANRALVEPKMDAFKARLAFNVSVDGDDCDAKSNSLWLRYWTTLATSLRNNPPKAPKVTVNLVVTSKAKEVTAEVSKDGSTFTFTAPRDLESRDWSDRLDRPFRQLAANLPDDFAFGLKESTGRFTSAWVLNRLHTFKVGKKCRARLGDKNEGALHAASFATRDVIEYVKAVGGDDWVQIESQSANDPAFNRELVSKSMDAFKGKLMITISVEGDDCDAKSNSLWLRYWTTAATALRNYPPRAGKVAIAINAISKARDVAVAAAKDGATITITAPRDIEVSGWSDKIEAPFRKVARKK
ncbi:MAG TPA: hypothetical protein VK932_22385 [Kofleriaceae bacterium]|nr:hypothetical protein [Kofleriaceae bacterium]